MSASHFLSMPFQPRLRTPCNTQLAKLPDPFSQQDKYMFHKLSITKRVQVPNHHILTQNLYYNYYYPNPKYLIIGYIGLRVTLSCSNAYPNNGLHCAEYARKKKGNHYTGLHRDELLRGSIPSFLAQQMPA